MTDLNQEPASKRPTHVAYQVKPTSGEKSFWSRVGSAWMHTDGKGITVQLDATPLDGRIVLRVVTEKKD